MARNELARTADRRVRLMLAASIAVLAIVLVRAAYVQALQGGRLGAMATRQQTRTIVLPITRAEISDRKGRPLAISKQSVAIGAYTGLVGDPQALASRLAPVLGIDRARLAAGLSNRTRPYVVIAHQVDPEVATRVR